MCGNKVIIITIKKENLLYSRFYRPSRPQRDNQRKQKRDKYLDLARELRKPYNKKVTDK